VGHNGRVGTLTWIVLLATAAAPGPDWEKLYERPAKEQPLLAVWADAEGWFAAGPGALVTGDKAGVQSQPQGQRTIVGFSGATRAELFAVGKNELVLKLEGTKWIEEHFVSGPVRSGPKSDDLIERVDTLMVDVKPMPAATGPSQVLVRHPDGTWQALPEVPKQKVLALAHQGPQEGSPAGCTRATWSWVGKDQGIFSCRDGRTFRFDAGKVTPLGKLGRGCKQGLDHARVRGPVAYTLCQGELHRSDGEGWLRLHVPAKLRDIAVTDRCLYAVSDRAVWRRCAR
jgi:hypothetical protein